MISYTGQIALEEYKNQIKNINSRLEKLERKLSISRIRVPIGKTLRKPKVFIYGGFEKIRESQAEIESVIQTLYEKYRLFGNVKVYLE